MHLITSNSYRCCISKNGIYHLHLLLDTAKDMENNSSSALFHSYWSSPNIKCSIQQEQLTAMRNYLTHSTKHRSHSMLSMQSISGILFLKRKQAKIETLSLPLQTITVLQLVTNLCVGIINIGLKFGKHLLDVCILKSVSAARRCCYLPLAFSAENRSARTDPGLPKHGGRHPISHMPTYSCSLIIVQRSGWFGSFYLLD